MCGKISYCKAKLGPFAEFLMVPSERIHSMDIPEPIGHFYYHSRVQDVEDQVEKVDGHYRSQAKIQLAVLKSLIKS